MTHESTTSLNDQGTRSGMRLELISKLCGSSTCPTIYQTDRGTLVVQGFAVEAGQAGVDLPPGERLVEIPVDLLKDAASGL